MIDLSTCNSAKKRSDDLLFPRHLPLLGPAVVHRRLIQLGTRITIFAVEERTRSVCCGSYSCILINRVGSGHHRKRLAVSRQSSTVPDDRTIPAMFTTLRIATDSTGGERPEGSSPWPFRPRFRADRFFSCHGAPVGGSGHLEPDPNAALSNLSSILGSTSHGLCWNH